MNSIFEAHTNFTTSQTELRVTWMLSYPDQINTRKTYKKTLICSVLKLRKPSYTGVIVNLLADGREHPTAHNPRITMIGKILIIVWGNFSPKFPSFYIQVSDMKFSDLSRYQRYHILRSDWLTGR